MPFSPVHPQIEQADCTPLVLSSSFASRLPLLVCPNCEQHLRRYSGSHCSLCGEPYSTPLSEARCYPCGECLTHPPPWEHLAFYGLYRGLLQALLLQLKYRQDFTMLPLLGGMLSSLYADLPPCDVVLAVPQFPAHLRARGFNQAHELARAMARHCDLPLRPSLLTRIRETLPQTRLSARERRENPRDSFAAGQVEHLKVLLVDDTMTTGSTLRHAAAALLAGKAASVTVAVVARTAPPGFELPAIVL